MPARPSITRIETFAIAARQITDADLPPGLADRINALVAEVNALRDTTVKIEDHQPIYLDPALYGGAPMQVGCTCGQRPKKPNQRASTTFSFYNSHLSRTGIPRPRYNPEPRYSYGPYEGMTWGERRAAEQATT